MGVRGTVFDSFLSGMDTSFFCCYEYMIFLEMLDLLDEICTVRCEFGSWYLYIFHTSGESLKTPTRGGTE